MAYTSVIFSRKIEKDEITKATVGTCISGIIEQDGRWNRWSFEIESENPVPLGILQEMEVEIKKVVDRIYRGIFTENE